MPILLLLIIVVFHNAFANEATLTADVITANTQKNKQETEVVVTAKGNVELSSQDFTVNTEELSVNSTTKHTIFPKKTTILYKHTTPITIVSQHLEGNPQTEEIAGKEIIMKSDIVSYKSKTVDIQKPLANFKGVTFSTCKMFNENNTACVVPWYGSASSLMYNYETKIIKAKNFRMNLHGIPIFYVPYIKFNLNKKKEGFQNFNVLTANSQQGITLDYIRHTKKYGDFTIRPEFYINSNSTNPELSRGNNIALLHEYTNKKDFITETQFKIAPNVNIPTSIGLYSGEKSNRYYLTTENIKTTANSAFNTNINLASDRFFHQVYNLEFQNYLQSNFTYTNFNQTDRLYKLDATNYNPITEANKNTIPMYISSAVYNKTLTNPKKPYTITSENEVFNFYRVDGTSGVRTTTVLDATKQIQTKLLTIETNPNLRLTNYNYLNNVDVSNHAQRVVGDINAKFYKPFLYKVGSFVMQTKPILFIDYTTDYTNGVVSNEDSFANFVRDDNVFLRSRYNGIDLVDSGLKTAYGIDLYAQDSKNRKFQLFIAQRYNTEENLSNYVGRAGAELGKLNLSSRFIVDNKTQKFLFSNSNARFEPLSFLEVGLGYFYLDESLQNQEIANITTTENITYSAIIKYNKHRLFFDIIQNPSFIGENDVKTNKLIGISGGIGYESDCLLYRLGMQRRIIFTGTQNITINSVILEFKISQ